MPVRLDRSSADFDARFATFLGAKREASADVEAAARAIGNAFVQERAETSVTKKRKQQHDHPQQH